MSKSATPLAFTETAHNHAHCIGQALEKAVGLCQQRGVRLTPLRHQVLKLIWQSHKPLGAYTILKNLHNEQQRRVAPPTVYRALDFLLAQGLIHRLASLNAFIGCWHPDAPHIGQFLICEGCGNAAEFDAPLINADMVQHAQQLGFRVEKQTIELMGQCAQCQQQPSIANQL